ncbi:MAG: hypothetical protein KDH96_01990 [Candidatus Riesia sp.]|nr:hypothetical protein [Candidatus Riesia sp.]
MHTPTKVNIASVEFSMSAAEVDSLYEILAFFKAGGKYECLEEEHKKAADSIRGAILNAAHPGYLGSRQEASPDCFDWPGSNVIKL